MQISLPPLFRITPKYFSQLPTSLDKNCSFETILMVIFAFLKLFEFRTPLSPSFREPKKGKRCELDNNSYSWWSPFLLSHTYTRGRRREEWPSSLHPTYVEFARRQMLPRGHAVRNIFVFFFFLESMWFKKLQNQAYKIFFFFCGQSWQKVCSSSEFDLRTFNNSRKGGKQRSLFPKPLPKKTPDAAAIILSLPDDTT